MAQNKQKQTSKNVPRLYRLARPRPGRRALDPHRTGSPPLPPDQDGLKRRFAKSAPPEPPQPKAGWKKRRSAEERRADGSYKPRNRKGPVAWTLTGSASPRMIRAFALSRKPMTGPSPALPDQTDTAAHPPKEVHDRL